MFQQIFFNKMNKCDFNTMKNCIISIWREKVLCHFSSES